MKVLPLFILIWFGLNHSLHAQTLEEKLADEICKCIEGRINDIENSTLLACYQEGVFKLKDDFNAIKDSLNRLGKEHGAQFEQRMNHRLIEDCLAYIGMMDSLRMSNIQNVSLKEVEHQLGELKNNSYLSKEGVLFEQGSLNFILGRYDESLKAFKKLVRKDKENRKAKLYIGWIYDLRKDYDKALIYYEDALQSAPEDKALKDVIRMVKVKKSKKI